MKTKNLKLQASSLLFALCTLHSALAQQVIYVDASNNTGNENGTQEHPFNTIKEGINAASPGYKVVIKQGTYIPDDSWSGNDHTLILKAGVYLMGEGADITIIQGIVVDQENSNLSIGMEKLRFDEFYFTRGTHEGPFSDLNIIKDCSTDYIDLPFGPGIPVNDTTPGPNYGFLIENNDLGTAGIIDFKQGAGVSDLTVQNNTCGYINLKSGGGYTYLIDNNHVQYGIFDKSASNLTIISNNTIYNGTISDYSGGNQYGIEDEIIENNVISADENSPAFIDEDYKAGITAKSRSVTIRNNTITCTGNVSGIRSSAGAPMNIMNNSITLSEVESPAPDPVESTCGIFNYSGWGQVSGNKITGGNMGYFSKAGTVEFASNEIAKSYTGFYSMGAEAVHHNIIKECFGDGMILDGLKGPISNNSIKDNGGAGIRVTRVPIDLGGGADSCQGNNIITGNGNFDLYVECISTQYPTLFARYNVWDHTDVTEIMQFDIRDSSDSTGLVNVDFTPFAYLGIEGQGGMEAWGLGGVEVWPNPTRGVVSLRSSVSGRRSAVSSQRPILSPEEQDEGSAVVEILDLNGKTLELWNSGTLELDLTSYPSGVYFLRINIDNEMIIKKIIKY